MTSQNIVLRSNNFNVDKYGNMSCSNANVSGNITSNNATITGGSVLLNGSNDGIQLIRVQKNNSNSTMAYIAPQMMALNNNGNNIELGYISGSRPNISLNYGSTSTEIYHDRIVTNGTTYNSKESLKKNIKLYNKKALDLIRKGEIYEYNYKAEEDTDQRHIGFVIADEGGRYQTPDEVISKNKDGIEQYNMSAIMWKAIQEQQQTIENLQNKIKELEGKTNE